jgi:hypothetical protein
LIAQANNQPLAVAEKWASCVGNANIPCLESLLTKNYRHTHGTGRVETKEQFITALENGSRKYEPIHFEDIQIQTTGKTSIVLGKFNLKVQANGSTLEAVNRFGMVVMGDHVIYFQATPLPIANRL